MNVLGLIFSILIVLSLSFATLFEKQLTAHKVLTSFIGHAVANRKIFNAYAAELSGGLNVESKEKKKKSDVHKKTKKKISEFNPACSRINLLPLIEGGKEEHPFLYKMFTSLCSAFYEDSLFQGDVKQQKIFLETFLKTAKQSLLEEKEDFCLEKLSFEDPLHRKIFYRMLKGSKECDLLQGIGFPALLDYVTLDRFQKKPCIKHAHPHFTYAFFGPKVAKKVRDALEQKDPPPITQELIEHFCSEAHHYSFDREIFERIDWQSTSCKKQGEVAFTGRDPESGISLRKTISVGKSG